MCTFHILKYVCKTLSLVREGSGRKRDRDREGDSEREENIFEKILKRLYFKFIF